MSARNSDTAQEEVPLVVLTLEPMQVREIRPVLRDSYMTGRPIFGELRRVNGDVTLFAGTVEPATARKIQKLLNPPSTK